MNQESMLALPVNGGKHDLLVAPRSQLFGNEMFDNLRGKLSRRMTRNANFMIVVVRSDLLNVSFRIFYTMNQIKNSDSRDAYHSLDEMNCYSSVCMNFKRPKRFN